VTENSFDARGFDGDLPGTGESLPQRFILWLSGELDREHAYHRSYGPTEHPVCLSEVEALGLWLVALDAEAGSFPDAATGSLAGRLARSLYRSLEQVTSGPDDDTEADVDGP
jgi:hypothetical protein